MQMQMGAHRQGDHSERALRPDLGEPRQARTVRDPYYVETCIQGALRLLGGIAWAIHSSAEARCFVQILVQTVCGLAVQRNFHRAGDEIPRNTHVEYPWDFAVDGCPHQSCSDPTTSQ